MATNTVSRPTSTVERQPKRKKEQRTDIWSNLLRQTRVAQARSRTQAVQHRELIVCGGSPEDQRSFVQSLIRPPPAQPPSRNHDKRQQKPKGELRLSNEYAYGYGHVTLYSPPQQSGIGVQVLGAEAEEVARLEVHTLPEPTEEYVATVRGLLQGRKQGEEEPEEEEPKENEATSDEERRPPGICILLSWKQPWKFLVQLKRWLQLLAQALLQPGTPATDPLDILKETQLRIIVVAQHTEAQEDLLKEGYREDDFDYISQCLRTVILPLHPLSALIYTASSAPPQPPGSPLSEPQKVVFNSLALDLAALSPKRLRSGSAAEKKEELTVKHEFMDRMAIVIPAGWDSPAFIRTLSETFSPEDIVNGWLADLQPPPSPKPRDQTSTEEQNPPANQANGGAEVYESSPVLEDANDMAEPPMSPSKMPPSAVQSYEQRVLDPQAHKAPKPPQIEVTTKPDQKFLAEMREHLQQLEAQDRDRESKGHHSGVSHTGLSGNSTRAGGLPIGESTGALSELGDVSFNVGGVSYDTITAEAAINALKRPQTRENEGTMSPPSSGTRHHTPKPRGPGGNRVEASVGRDTPGSGVKSPESKAPLDVDKLEEYFQSLLTKSGGGPSKTSTPTRRGTGVE